MARVRFQWWHAPLFGLLALLGKRVVSRARRFDYFGKVVLITGGSRGLGLVLARALARRGAKVALCARSEEELRRAERQLAVHGADVESFVCDVTHEAEVRRMVEGVVDAFGRLDVLINNAGVTQVGPLTAVNESDFEEAMAINFWGPLHVTMAALPHLKASGDGRVVNISSIGGKIAVPHLLPYSASKFALTGFSEGLRAELVDDHVKVTTVCPGLIRTGSPRNATFKGHRADREYQWFSISASLPFLTMSAGRAAEKILDACAEGKSEVMLSWWARAATWFHGLFPGVTSSLMSLGNEVLPRNSNDRYSFLGRATGSERAHPWLTFLGDRAALRNNEV